MVPCGRLDLESPCSAAVLTAPPHPPHPIPCRKKCFRLLSCVVAACSSGSSWDSAPLNSQGPWFTSTGLTVEGAEGRGLWVCFKEVKPSQSVEEAVVLPALDVWRNPPNLQWCWGSRRASGGLPGGKGA